jgi:hypothetical protein
VTRVNLVQGFPYGRDVLQRRAMQPWVLKGERALSNARGRLDRVPSRSSVATHRALFHDADERRCDLCESPIAKGEEQGGSGLYVWTRGDHVRYEEPPLCRDCGDRLVMLASRRWEEEEEEEG